MSEVDFIGFAALITAIGNAIIIPLVSLLLTRQKKNAQKIESLDHKINGRMEQLLKLEYERGLHDGKKSDA